MQPKLQATAAPDPIEAAYEVLNSSLVYYQGRPVGTIATHHPKASAVNYSECFVRDFVPSALVFLLDGKPEIVRNFLEMVLRLRDQQEELEGHQNLPRVMPACFKVVTNGAGQEELHADFGNRAIGRVAPVDSMMWWILLLDAYVRYTGDRAFAEMAECQRGVRTIMNICLRDRFEVFPTLLVPDGSFMIDRRMGVFGHPLEIQSLFYAALERSQRLLVPSEENKFLLELIGQRQQTLTDYVRRYYWLDPKRLNDIHRYETELFGDESTNELNIYPDSIPEWVTDWLPDNAGYMVGNLGPGRMDFRFFSLGNLLAVLYGLATDIQSRQIMRVFEVRWSELIGMMPVKIIYPAMQDEEWHLLTGGDPKNRPWCYHNGGNWPALLWAFVGACLHTKRRKMAQNAVQIACRRLVQDDWPEYYDGKNGRLIGRRSNHQQTWSATSLILSQKLLEDPEALALLGVPFES